MIMGLRIQCNCIHDIAYSINCTQKGHSGKYKLFRIAVYRSPDFTNSFSLFGETEIVPTFPQTEKHA